MKLTILLLCFGSLLFSQCKNPEELVEYYENGEVRFKCGMLDGEKHGEGFWFYRDGSIEKRAYWDKGIKTDHEISYYPSGSISSIFNYKDGVKSGTFVAFDDKGLLTKSGRYFEGKPLGFQHDYLGGWLVQTEEIIRVEDSLVKNLCVLHNIWSGISLNSSSIWSVVRNTDSVRVNEPFEFTLLLQTPGFFLDELEKVRVVVGDFDEYYNLKSVENIDTLWFTNNNLELDITRTFSEVGKQTVRGKILNGTKQDHSSSICKENVKFFKYDVIVF